MIYLFYGDDKARLLNRLQELKNSVEGSDIGTNYKEIGSEVPLSDIMSEANSMPFLATRRVLVIHDLLSSKNKQKLEQANAWFPSVSKDVDLILVENVNPDQRLTITKTLQKIAKIEVFGNLKPVEVNKYVLDYVNRRDGSINQSDANLLQLYMGNDISRINNELDKLLAYSKKIDKNSIDLLVNAGYFNTIFDLTDAMSVKNSKKALYNLQKLLENGENELYVISMLAMQVRNLLLVKDLKSHGLSESEIASRSKLHPFVVKKAIGQISNFTTEGLVRLHRQLLEMDYAIKTGKSDPKTLLDKYIIESTT